MAPTMGAKYDKMPYHCYNRHRAMILASLVNFVDDTVKTKISYVYPIIMSAEFSKFKIAAITTKNY